MAGTLIPTLDEAVRIELQGFTVAINDVANFHCLRKDLFERRIYHFESTTDRPRILDCGGNIGLAALYFKKHFPGARITAFEPDPIVADFFHHNMVVNNTQDVELVRAALAAEAGEARFHADGKYAGSLACYGGPADASECEVPCVRLSEYLSEPVDFLKMNIEGAEWDVLDECSSVIHRVDRMVIEYHHLPGLPRTLHRILTLLHESGFEYLINDFDRITNPHVEPPFRLSPRSSYYLLVFAQRKDGVA